MKKLGRIFFWIILIGFFPVIAVMFMAGSLFAILKEFWMKGYYQTYIRLGSDDKKDDK